MRKSFSKVFEPIPHVNELPLEPLARITLKDAEKIIKTEITLVLVNGRMLGMSCSNNT